MNPIRALAFLALAAAIAAPASAADGWHETEGARIRLLAEPTGPDGIIRGALQIDLEPGWKTYWRDPIDSGVPPALGVKGMESELHFPAPRWLSDHYSTYAGYDRPVLFPVTFEPKASVAGALQAEIFLGVCETICIPVSGTLTAMPAAPDTAGGRIVEAAFAALPHAARNGFEARVTSEELKYFIVEAALPDGAADAQLFVASSPYHTVGVPRRIEEPDGVVRFEVPIEGLAARIVEAELPYTMTSTAGAVSGTLTVSY